MPSRPDIRDLVTNVRDAFADADRETLLEVLTFVVKEYVVEGPPPMLIHQAETLSDLQGMTFAQLVSALQTRFDHPELAMLVVDGEQVGVRVGGVVHPLLPGRTPPPGVTMVDTRPPPQPGVRVVEANLAPRPPAAPPAPQPGQAPPPSRGLSVRGQPGAAPAAAATPAAPAQAPAQPAQPAAPAAPAAPDKPDKPEGAGDDASARFSLLELD
jgi:hypothetical protein